MNTIPANSTPPQPRRPIDQIVSDLEKMRGQLQIMLPSHIPVDRFVRVIRTALNRNPDLQVADRRSLFNSAALAAQDGLMPDGREGALVIFKDKSGKKMVQWMAMIYGIEKLIRQTGEIDKISVHIVYRNEIDQGRFKYEIVNGEEQINHTPIIDGERGEKVLVYASARFKETGQLVYAVLHRDDILKRRAVSKAQSDSGPWKQWEDEMWKKTAIRTLAKHLPLSAEIQRAVENESDEPTEFDKLKDAALQDATVAMQQLGAPQAEPETETSEGHAVDGGGEDPDEYAKEILQRALDRLVEQEFEDKQELEEYGKLIRDTLKSETSNEELRERLLLEFQGPFMERLRAFGGLL